MLQFRKMILIFTSVFFLPVMCAYADEKIEDLIDTFESKGKVTAVIGGEKTVSVNLRPKETILWDSAAGHMAAFLTNDRFLVISVSSGTWRALPLRIGESKTCTASLSPFIALLVSKDRAVGFVSGSDHFVDTQLPIHDDLLKVEAEKYIAVVITSSRAYGLSATSGGFTEIFFRLQETIVETRITSSKATIRTSGRLLSFGARSSGWNEHQL